MFGYDPFSPTNTSQRMEGPIAALGVCLHTSPTPQNPHGRLRRKNELDLDYIKKMQKEARHRSVWPSERVGYMDKDKR